MCLSIPGHVFLDRKESLRLAWCLKVHRRININTVEGSLKIQLLPEFPKYTNMLLWLKMLQRKLHCLFSPGRSQCTNSTALRAQPALTLAAGLPATRAAHGRPTVVLTLLHLCVFPALRQASSLGYIKQNPPNTPAVNSPLILQCLDCRKTF